MHAPHFRRLLTTIAIAAAATAVVGAGGALASAAAPSTARSTRRTVAVNADLQAPPEVVTYADPCSATNPVPTVGLCRGTSSGSVTYTRDLQGTSVYQTAFTTDNSGASYYVALETFTGTVAGCGTGTMTLREVGTLAATGELQYTWQVVQELGTDGLANVTGHGTVTATYNFSDGTQTGQLTGRLHCNRSH